MENRPNSSSPIESAILEIGRADLGKVFRLAYVSRASSCFQPADLNDIEEKSAPKNEAADITGILVMDAGNILQILEGEKSVFSVFLRLFPRIPVMKRFGKWPGVTKRGGH